MVPYRRLRVVAQYVGKDADLQASHHTQLTAHRCGRHCRCGAPLAVQLGELSLQLLHSALVAEVAEDLKRPVMARARIFNTPLRDLGDRDGEASADRGLAAKATFKKLWRTARTRALKLSDDRARD